MRPLRRLAVFVAIAGGLLTQAGCAHAPWNPYGGWTAIRSKHITIYTDTKFLHSAALEAFELSYAALAGSLFRKRPIAPVEVVFLEDLELKSTLGENRNGVSIARLPGRGFLGRRGIIVATEAGGVGTMAHRLAHLFLHAVAPTAPLWVHEGYASYVEGIEYRSSGSDHVACLGHVVGDDPLIPLADLFSWTWAQYDESKKTSWYRHTARLLFDYFLSAEDGAHRERFVAVLAEVGAGRPAPEVLARVYPGVSLATLQERVVTHRRASEMRPRGLCPITFPIDPARHADRSKPRSEEVPKEDIEQLMLRLWMLPRRMGYVDWYPPEAITIVKPGATK